MFTSRQVDSRLSYAIAIVLPALDAIFPVLPSETAIIGLGVATAGSADPRIALLVAYAALRAFVGDNLSYLPGRRFGPLVERRFFAGEKGAGPRGALSPTKITRIGRRRRIPSGTRLREARTYTLYEGCWTVIGTTPLHSLSAGDVRSAITQHAAGSSSLASPPGTKTSRRAHRAA